MKYRRRPVEVEAVQWTGQPVSELPWWLRKEGVFAHKNNTLWVRNMPIYFGGWAILLPETIKTENDAEFRATYEPMTDADQA